MPPAPAEDRARSAGGEFTEQYSDDDIVQVLADAFPEPLAATEVGDRAGMARTTAHNRLEALVEDGHVATKKLGARARAYWLADHDRAAAIRDQDDTDAA